MKEMLATGNHHHGQVLWPRPVEHCRERRHVVQFAVYDECAACNCASLEAADRGRYQYQLLWINLFRSARLNKTSEGKSCACEW